MAPSLLMLAHVGPKLAPRCPQVGPCRPMLAPSGHHDWPSSRVSPRLAKVSTKALPLRPGFSKMSTRALPQAFRCGPSSKVSPKRVIEGVHESSASKAWIFPGVPTFDNSFGLFHPLAFDHECCSFLVLLSACLVMSGLSKRFIQTFL